MIDVPGVVVSVGMLRRPGRRHEQKQLEDVKVKLAKRICCIEGHWNYGKREVEPSVEPMLQLLTGMGQWEYARRDCATEGEFYFFLDQEWNRCKEGSILYIASHGEAGVIWLSDKQSVKLDTLATEADCSNCLVHFGSCSVLNVDDRRIGGFLKNTGASCVSGYKADTGWADLSYYPPAIALELLLFSSIWKDGIDLTTGYSAKSMRKLRKKLQCKFEECEFELHTKWDPRMRHAAGDPS